MFNFMASYTFVGRKGSMFWVDNGLASPPFGILADVTVNSRKKMILRTVSFVYMNGLNSHCFDQRCPPRKVRLEPLAQFFEKLSKRRAKYQNLKNLQRISTLWYTMDGEQLTELAKHMLPIFTSPLGIVTVLSRPLPFPPCSGQIPSESKRANSSAGERVVEPEAAAAA